MGLYRCSRPSGRLRIETLDGQAACGDRSGLQPPFGAAED